MKNIRFQNLDQAKAYILKNPDSLSANEFLHCAHSIEYSIDGFPLSKGPFFQKTLGHFIALVFLYLGRMKHNLAAPVPGAPQELAISKEKSFQRLMTAIDRFKIAKELKPHFAYGALSLKDTDSLQAFHIADHVSGNLII